MDASAGTTVELPVVVTGTRNVSASPRNPATSNVWGRSAGKACGAVRFTVPVSRSRAMTSTPAVSSQDCVQSPRSLPLAPSMKPMKSASVPLPNACSRR